MSRRKHHRLVYLFLLTSASLACLFAKHSEDPLLYLKRDLTLTQLKVAVGMRSEGKESAD